MNSARLTVPIIGLSLGGCGSLTIEGVLRELPGVLEVYVNPATESAYLRYDGDRLVPDEIVAAIRRLGYQTAVVGGRR
jgi:copper chaperone CopZ